MEAGTARVIGTKTKRVVREVAYLLDDSTACRKMANAVNPYGDGHAARRTVDSIRSFFGLLTTPPQPFRVDLPAMDEIEVRALSQVEEAEHGIR